MENGLLGALWVENSLRFLSLVVHQDQVVQHQPKGLPDSRIMFFSIDFLCLSWQKIPESFLGREEGIFFIELTNFFLSLILIFNPEFFKTYPL